MQEQLSRFAAIRYRICMKPKELLSFLLWLSCILFAKDTVAQIPTSWGSRTITAGSKIIDMGIVPQTTANALKPYGLVYDLVKNQNVPVLWCIKQNKTKDGVDFVQDGITYKGGPFVIPQEYLTTAVNTTISNWTALGVVVRTTTTTATLPVFMEITAWPVWVLDQANGTIAQTFLNGAGIPASAYSFKNPSALDCCDNMFMMPHADPTWANHSRIYSWIKSTDSTGGCAGWYWGGCHATSVIENLSNPLASWQKMNFLSTNGLVPFGSHNDGTVPYINDSFPSNPIMQFMGKIDAATTNGSERIYLPSLTSAWRSTTQVGVYDPTQADIPTKSAGKAAVLLYGPAFGNYANGYAMYEAGHDVSGTGADQIAAQRAMLNFSFIGPLLQLQTISGCNIPDTIYAGNSQPLSATISGKGAPFSYSWSSDCPSIIFGSTTTNPTTITIPNTFTDSFYHCSITINVTNTCGKSVFCKKNIVAQRVFVLPLELRSFSGTKSSNDVLLDWKTDNETDIVSYRVERSFDGKDFTEVGNISADPAARGSYQFVHANANDVLAPQIFYRITAVQQSGKKRTSRQLVIRYDMTASLQVKIAPNPAADIAAIQITSPKSQLVNLRVENLSGNVVFKTGSFLNAGNNAIQLRNLNRFPAGIYSVIINGETCKTISKLIISH